MIRVLRAVMSLPVEEANELLRSVIPEIEGRKDGILQSQCRLLVWGPEIDDPALYELIEGLGANVVADDQCIGTRFFWHDVEKMADPLDGLSKHYLGDQYCPRIIRGKGEGWATRQQDLEDRFGHVARFAKEFSVDGIILYVMKYCDLHEFDVPDISDYLTKQGYPVLHIETDYSMAAVAGLRTRIEAFLEMIGQQDRA
jgi:benzoyl-CoA reductase subunit C